MHENYSHVTTYGHLKELIFYITSVISFDVLKLCSLIYECFGLQSEKCPVIVYVIQKSTAFFPGELYRRPDP